MAKHPEVREEVEEIKRKLIGAERETAIRPATQWQDFQPWNEVFWFTMDVCATPPNTRRYWTKKHYAIGFTWLDEVCRRTFENHRS